MSFEDDINNLNEYFFFREFTYSKNTFKRLDGQEVEVADSIVYLEEIAFVFQLKERFISIDSTPAQEKKWFKKKVLTAATKQIRDTVSYINSHQDVSLFNNRGHSIDISTADLSILHKVVIHKSSKILPRDCQNTKFHISQTAGVIHIFQAQDYLEVVHYLLTPSELADYLRFRINLIAKYGEKVNLIKEPALLGQYLAGGEISEPSAEYLKYTATLDRQTEDWDMTGIIKLFQDRIVGAEMSDEYYCIVKEVAKLKRNELVAFKERYMLSWNAAKSNESVRPYRFMTHRTGCAFLFLPLLQSEKTQRDDILKNYTFVNMYDLHANKAIGVSFIGSKGGWQDVQWCYIEFPWRKDSKLDELLNAGSPFREVKEKNTEVYNFQ